MPSQVNPSPTGIPATYMGWPDVLAITSQPMMSLNPPPNSPATPSIQEAKLETKAPTDPGVVSDEARKLNVTWGAGGLQFRSVDDLFTFHIGGRLMTDSVWWNQSPDLRKSAAQPPGSPLSQITGVGPGVGDLVDGAFVRRARFIADGTIFKNAEFKIEFDYENYNNIAFDESYVGLRNVPFIGMIRFGQEHVPFGLEAYTSSRFLPMLERSPLYDSFYQEFAPGLFTNTTFLDERITMQHMIHRIDNFSQFNGASFGDGKYAYSGRVSVLPEYEDGGRDLLHLAIAYQWRKGSSPLDFNGGTTISSTPNPNVTTNTGIIEFRTRAGIRDGVGLQGDNSRIIDTGTIIGDHIQSVNGEFLWYRGPFWVQSETDVSVVNNAVFPDSKNATQRGNLTFWGTYVQTGFFLTGENRGYDTSMGKYSRVVPRTNFFFDKDDEGRIRFGPGAWEVVYRYSYVCLNDQSIQGGLYSEHTIGLNWYWNSNIKIQMNYVNGQRMVPAPANSGNIQGFGVRGALEF
jgi:phosphate-selective porin OprO/OprP